MVLKSYSIRELEITSVKKQLRKNKVLFGLEIVPFIGDQLDVT